MVKEKLRCIFVLDLLKIFIGRLPQKNLLKSRFFAVTLKKIVRMTKFKLLLTVP